MIDLDVRAILSAKGNPLKTILAEADKVPIGDQLNLHTTFKPSPLFRVLAKRGFEHSIEQIEKRHFVTHFTRIELK
ncbi:DUF2249 domain-containing protein [Alicyclobacillus sp. SO9]|uniref:DUF2249 domain-containing protein n=1 Tax=Alicyclobacillus sp. SO9 TaxID=2665646 RepID=UPI0018E71871|nr:DUF2249 domain-containing protein [Alicyclobacillus sp. SO9]QQE81008.1 DUF2249 domain-containing protein [Alicyclobacillus sp. SO9]